MWWLYKISYYVECQHSQQDILPFLQAILSTPPDVVGCVVEAGAFKGGSTAKYSLVTRAAGRRLLVFDSFCGLPETQEGHDKNIFGGTSRFAKGDWAGSLGEVRENVSRFGAIEACEFVEGWFEDTMPGFKEPVIAAYLDVDLASSTRTCLKYLYPLLVPGGKILSHDGHLPIVVEVYQDEAFWRDDLGVQPPVIEGLGRKKVIRVTKPVQAGGAPH